MIRRYGAGFRSLLMGADFAATIVAALFISRLLFDGQEQGVWQAALPNSEAALLIYAIAWVVVLWTQGLYRPRARWSLSGEAMAVVRAVVVMVLGASFVLYVSKLPEVSRVFLFLLLGAQFSAALAARGILRAVAAGLRIRGYNMRNVLVLGTGHEARDFAERLDRRRELGLRVIGYLGDRDSIVPAPHRLGPLDRLADVLHQQVVDEVAMCLPASQWPRIADLLSLCESEGKIVRMPMILPTVTMSRGNIEDLDGLPVLSLLTRPHAIAGMSFKRFVDVAVAAIGLVVISPLLLGLSIAILLTSGRPVLFRQERVGLNGRSFSLVKFRTMIPDAEARRAELLDANEIDGFAFKVTDDPRVTAFGGWLRRSSLDELPQLWNVLRGEMSLVGPRPPLPSEVDEYHPWHRRRLSMKPGITGLWQIEGRRDPSFDHWVRKDLEYIDRWTPMLDFEILLRTIPAVLRAEGR